MASKTTAKDNTMIRILISPPYDMFRVRELTVTKAELAGILGSLAEGQGPPEWGYDAVSSCPNGHMMCYFFPNGVTVHVPVKGES
jgi:hypothetical protein